MVISLERRFDSGPVTRQELSALDALRPHVARAAQLAARLRLQKDEVTLKILEKAGIAAALVGSGRQLLGTNHAFDALEGPIAPRAFERIALDDQTSNLLFTSALAAIFNGNVDEPLFIAVPQTEASPALILHVLPLCKNARDLFAEARALLIASATVRAL